MANIHPFFSGIDVNAASNWTLQFLQDNVISTTVGLDPKPAIIISEGLSSLIALIAVGWPSGSGSVNSSIAGISEMQIFVDHFPAAATNANVTYYWFEGYDEPWKIMYDTATDQYEDHWVFSSSVGLIVGYIRCEWVFEKWDYTAG
jgi:exo-beta-1,3-glucanase (GH17 family)